jgi:hypothetical protein
MTLLHPLLLQAWSGFGFLLGKAGWSKLKASSTAGIFDQISPGKALEWPDANGYCSCSRRCDCWDIRVDWVVDGAQSREGISSDVFWAGAYRGLLRDFRYGGRVVFRCGLQRGRTPLPDPDSH